jgi:hypothetical protein
MPAVRRSAASFNGRIGGELRAEGVDTPLLGEVRLRRLDSVWRARRALAALLTREKFDVAVCRGLAIRVFRPRHQARKVPLVVWLHMIE